ncbi:MAG TPA: hypothetical protein VHW23_11560 [Kofleriaceae bacterium]|jgi:hypothetical protein|nr:hypothetical protein [Kofleriaceae bacterium]
MTEPATPAGAPATDLPPVPRSKLSRMAVVLGVFGAVITAGYAALAYTDYEPGTPERDEIPASVRSSPGGYRSFHFWHSGYHGGK